MVFSQDVPGWLLGLIFEPVSIAPIGYLFIQRRILRGITTA